MNHLLPTTSALSSTQDRLVSIRNVSLQLDLSTRAVYRLVAKGEIPPPVKVGGSTRFYQSDLDDYLNRLKAARPSI